MVNMPGTNAVNSDSLPLHESSDIFISPGRFFAAALLKTMLAHVVMLYDVKLEDNKARLKSSVPPHPAEKIMFRRRAY